MPLPPATRFGPFEIVGFIGAGGMGEVYRARDTKLDRDVAIKVLPGAFTSDPDRLARFEREAKTLASLNHPNIAHVYGLEDSAPASGSGSGRGLVMELVEGEELEDRIARGPVNVPDALRIARQISDAIASAHDHGIIHRDLKPSNIKVTADGAVKVLDFGIAKALGSDPTAAGSAPTITGTAHGAILGTAAYMSPEQARGQAVDARADIWAFGCVLYEMLTGRRAFPGATTSDTIAKILEREPDWNALPSSTPSSLRRLLTRCLEKDPKLRLHAVADAHFEIDEALVESKSGSGTASARAPAGTGRWPIVAGVVAVLLAIAVWQIFPRQAADLPAPRVMPLTSYPGIEATPSFSPDGTQVAFSWDGGSGDNEDVYVVIVGSDSPLPLTKDPAPDVSPAWKPDGSQIAFARVQGSRASIYTVSPLGQSEQKLAEFSAIPCVDCPVGVNDPRLAWSPDGRWLVVSRVTSGPELGAFVLAEDGSTRRLLLPSDVPGEPRVTAFSPKGNALAYATSGYIEVVELDATEPLSVTKAPRRLTSFLGFVGGLAWTVDGKELVFGQAQWAAPPPSHLWRLAASGEGAPELIDLAGVAGTPAVSALGQRLAFSRRNMNLDLFKLQEGRAPEVILASTFNEQDASFSPDGSKVAFASDRTSESDGNQIWIANAADGSNRRSVTKGAHKPEGSPRWSPDGRRLAYDGLGDDGQRHIYVVDEAGGQVRGVAGKAGVNDQLPSWSRDGKWIYFESDRTGRNEVWRAPVAGGDPQQITTTGGEAPFESWDGRTLYFMRPSQGRRMLFERPVTGGSERELGITTPFWNYVPGESGLYYVSMPIGQKQPYTYEVRHRDMTAGKDRVLYSVRLASNSPGLSVLPDGKTVLISGVAEISQDLLRIENFR